MGPSDDDICLVQAITHPHSPQAITEVSHRDIVLGGGAMLLA